MNFNENLTQPFINSCMYQEGGQGSGTGLKDEQRKKIPTIVEIFEGTQNSNINKNKTEGK